MKILFCELLYPQTHARSNNFYITSINAVADEMHVLSPEGFYGDLPENVILHMLECKSHSGKLGYRFDGLQYSKKILDVVNTYHIDRVVVASADYVTLTYLAKKIRARVYLIHHAELDAIGNNKIKQMFFSLYKNEIYHLVFEEFIREYLINAFSVEPQRVFVLPHSLNNNNTVKSRKNDINYKLVGLSNSNDEDIVEQFISLENDKQIFKSNSVKVFLKSKSQRFDDGFLTVTNEYLSNEDYNDSINSAEYILVPFSKDFCYRESGTLMDALSNHKKVIGADIKIMRCYQQEYPRSCFIFNDIKDILDIILHDDRFADYSEFDAFRKKHSFEHEVQVFRKIFA